MLGAVMDLVKSAEVFHFVAGKISAGQKAIVANHNLHSLYLMRRLPEVRAFFAKADLVEVDSIPLLFWARLIGRPSRRFHRCTYLDWREELWSHAAANGWRVFFLGAEPGVGERAADKIRECWPQVQLSTHHGYFDTESGSVENDAVLETLAAYRPHILLVGMGMPLQEIWTLRNYDRLPNCVVFTVGGAFDYEAGSQAIAPRWIGRLGGEWLFRLLANPVRMFPRYCIEPWSLCGAALGDIATAIYDRLRPFKAAAKAGGVQSAPSDI